MMMSVAFSDPCASIDDEESTKSYNGAWTRMLTRRRPWRRVCCACRKRWGEGDVDFGMFLRGLMDPLEDVNDFLRSD